MPRWSRALPFLALLSSSSACSTFVVTSAASDDGSVFAAHSNDWGSSPAPGTLHLVPSADHAPNATRAVSGGSIPQVPHTYQYLTGGYGSLNEHGLGIAESTCSHKPWPNPTANKGILNIVDLSRLVLERARSAREGIETLGALAETHGYRDNAESLLVVDSAEAYVFHILPSPQAVGAVWAAQKVPDGHVAAVTNAFTIREIDLGGPDAGATGEGEFLFSSNMVPAAVSAGFYAPNTTSTFDFTRVFAGGSGPQYASGRRMWRIYTLLSPQANLSSTYDDYILDAPYPATLPASNVSLPLAFRVMRDFYNGTEYALDSGMAGGYAGNPTRWSPGEGEQRVKGSWERPISLYRSQITFVIQLRAAESGLLPLIHYSPNAAYSGTYVALTPRMSALPPCVCNGTSWGRIEKWSLAWATRYLFNLMQVRWDRMYPSLDVARAAFEDETAALLAQLDASTPPHVLDHVLGSRAAEAVAWLWSQSDALMVAFANNGGGPAGYPAWWLASPEVGYEQGPAAHDDSSTIRTIRTRSGS